MESSNFHITDDQNEVVAPDVLRQVCVVDGTTNDEAFLQRRETRRVSKLERTGDVGSRALPEHARKCQIANHMPTFKMPSLEAETNCDQTGSLSSPTVQV